MTATTGSNSTAPRKHFCFVVLVFSAFVFSTTSGCVDANSEDLDEVDEPEVQLLVNSPGTREENIRNMKPAEILIERIDGAKSSIEMGVYGFSHRGLIDAIIRAHKRGVDVRVAGDAGHFQSGEEGYAALEKHHIPMQFGNRSSIMHNKFIIIDNRFVFVGTGNFTGTGFRRNINNWVFIDSQPLAEDFQAEFEQMFHGRYSNQKNRINNGNRYQVGDTTVDVYFSPQEDVIGRMLEELNNVNESIHFQIFAFTKDRIGGQFIRQHRKFMDKNAELAEQGELPDDWRTSMSPREWPYKVTGILDRSQVHGNGQYHEGYRLQAFGVPMRLDNNESSVIPGDYQAGGGRLHTKTMILDAGTENARVITGSFNWSAAASVSNDEVLMVLHGRDIAREYMEVFDNLWRESRSISGGFCQIMDTPRPACSKQIDPGDVVFSEIHWDGWNGRRDPQDHTGRLGERDQITNDEFIELHNTTDRAINLSMWTITNGKDFKVGFPPGTVISPGEYFLVLDHNIESYSENKPQRGKHAFQNGDFVLNTANDPRFHRLEIKNASLSLDLRDATGQVIDKAGNGTPPFYGGRTPGPNNETVENVHSMERRIPEDGQIPSGRKQESWYSSNASGEEEQQNINPKYRDFITATPGAPNSSAP